MSLLRRPSLSLAPLLLAACGSEVYVHAPWPHDAEVALVITGADDVPMEGTPRLLGPAVERLSVPGARPFRLHAYAYAPPGAGDSQDLARCGLRFGGEGARPARALGAWVSALLDPESDAPVSLEETAAPVDFDLRYEHCNEEVYDCGAVQVEALSVPAELHAQNLLSVAAVHDELAFFAVHGVGPNNSARVGRVRSGTVEMLASGFDYLRSARHLAFDEVDTVWGMSAVGKVFSMSTSGVVTSSTALDVTGTPDFLGVRGKDGAVLAYGPFGVRVLAPGAAAIDRPALEGLRWPVEVMGFERTDGVMAVANSFYYYFDGRGWRPEREQRPSVFERIFDAASGGGRALTVGHLGVSYERDEHGTWSEVTRAGAEGSLRGVESMGGGRFIAVGDGGFIGVYADRRWCIVADPVANILESVSIAPSGRVGYVVGRAAEESSDDPPAVLRIRLP